MATTRIYDDAREYLQGMALADVLLTTGISVALSKMFHGARVDLTEDLVRTIGINAVAGTIAKFIVLELAQTQVASAIGLHSRKRTRKQSSN